MKYIFCCPFGIVLLEWQPERVCSKKKKNLRKKLFFLFLRGKKKNMRNENCFYLCMPNLVLLFLFHEKYSSKKQVQGVKREKGTKRTNPAFPTNWSVFFFFKPVFLPIQLLYLRPYLSSSYFQEWLLLRLSMELASSIRGSTVSIQLWTALCLVLTLWDRQDRRGAWEGDVSSQM